MNRMLQILISACAASVLPFSALAQNPTNSDKERAGFNRNHVPYAQRSNRLKDVAKASDVIGMTVKNYQDEKLGKVDDLAVDVESGRIVQVILSTGGFFGIGDTLTAVPPGALHHDGARKILNLDATNEKLQGAPKFEMSQWAENCDSNHLAEVYRLYDEEPAFHFIQSGAAVVTAPRQSTNQAMIPTSRLGYVQKASKLIGTPVQNLLYQKLGKVENLLVDLPLGRVVAVIISSGEYLGRGNELSAVPPNALRLTVDRDLLQLDVTKEMLRNTPHFKANDWPDFSQPAYVHGVYRVYRVEPYFTTNQTAEPNIKPLAIQ